MDKVIETSIHHKNLDSTWIGIFVWLYWGVKAFCVKSFKGRVRHDSPKVNQHPHWHLHVFEQGRFSGLIIKPKKS
jgi:hypothetical protein